MGNHVAPVDTAYEKINPFNESQYYHSKCQIEDWNNQEEVETCRLSNLPDLDQNNSFVRSTLLQWVGSLKEKYDFDGKEDEDYRLCGSLLVMTTLVMVLWVLCNIVTIYDDLSTG